MPVVGEDVSANGRVHTLVAVGGVLVGVVSVVNHMEVVALVSEQEGIFVVGTWRLGSKCREWQIQVTTSQ
jgi:hypothetical protein